MVRYEEWGGTSEGILIKELSNIECAQESSVFRAIHAVPSQHTASVTTARGEAFTLSLDAEREEITDLLNSRGYNLAAPNPGSNPEYDGIVLESREDQLWYEVLYDLGQYSWRLEEVVPALWISRVVRQPYAAHVTLRDPGRTMDFAFDFTTGIEPIGWIFDMFHDFTIMNEITWRPW